VTFTAYVPEIDNFNGRGGRAAPLMLDGQGFQVNLLPGLSTYLTARLGINCGDRDIVAYVAGVCGLSGYTEKFADELQEPGVRVPLTADPELFGEAVEMGQRAIWLNCFGERFVDPNAGRPFGNPAPVTAMRPKVVTSIPDSEEGMPETMSYDSATETLHVGDGAIAPVLQGVWDYQVSGFAVVEKWFSYRKKNPAGRRTSPLDDIVSATWTSTITTELLQLLSVLASFVEMEPRQMKLLDLIADGPVVTIDDLSGAGVLPVPAAATKPPADLGDDGGAKLF
jgi:hypothetical protein